VVLIAVHLPLIHLLPNRVRRNYRGGSLLDALDGNPAPRDGNRPEDWLASTVPAVNPGMEPIPDEGLAEVRDSSGEMVKLRDLFAQAPDYYLGAEHAERLGPHLGFLAKLLDSSMRLHVQAHPTAAFAREHLHSPWGKLEAYVILALRDEAQAYIRLGFQRPPAPEEWRRIVLDQDIAAMDACFDPIPVQASEVWLVPGGLPHAIGEGVLMLEVMEPSDLVVRCEFEREGVIVPPEARFMQSPVDLALQIFDYTPLSVAQAQDTYKISPRKISPGDDLLIGPSQTDCFSVTRMTVADGPMNLPTPGSAMLGVVASGHGNVTIGARTISLNHGSRFFCAASAPGGEITNSGGEALEILFCSSGQVA
jgi:mannose-6-phosphate isomerase